MNDKKVKKDIKDAEDYKDKYLRALADYQNFEKRVRQEKEYVAKMAEARIILKFLPFLDNLEKAEIFIKDQGLKMIKDQLIQALKQSGVEELDLQNKEFDPQYAEAVEVVEGDKDNIVVEVLQKGYLFEGQLLRPAQVKVSRKK
ncbi:MAG: nucleotide exchange factor GrpE [Candidatus Roizmanbacteria bacterium]|nr:MAG: nucleotide exchange factor GrpE [Candidatus Roizmanbacteria bacterium]